jgi:Lon protease-like protein
MERIPLFPLDVVLLPRMPLPLHIFEERYKIMIAECVQRGIPFGIVYVRGEQIESVGCSARVERVLNTYADGRMDIVARGRGRFHIERLLEEKPYLEADVDFFVDYETNPEGEIWRLMKEGIALLTQFFRMTGGGIDGKDADRIVSPRHSEGDSERTPREAEDLSFMIASIDGFGNELRQKLIEMTSTRKRLDLGVSILKGIVSRLNVKQELKRVFGTETDMDARH